MRGIAHRTHAFIASEPRRDAVGRMAALAVGLIGANAVTRADAVKSVAAGFRDDELAAAWEDGGIDWKIHEFRAAPFTHCFTAVRRQQPWRDQLMGDIADALVIGAGPAGCASAILLAQAGGT